MALRMPTLTQVTPSRAKLFDPVIACGVDCVDGARPTRVALNPLTSTLALPAMVSN